MVRIGILLTYPKNEAKKEELIPYKKGCDVRPWLEKAAPPELVTKRTHRRSRRVDADTHPLGKYGVPTDVASGCYIKYQHAKEGVEVDFILPHDISLERLKANDINFLLIYDLLEAFHTDKSEGKPIYHTLRKCLNEAGNVYPPLEYQELIYSKINYYNYLKENDVSIAPTLTMTADEYNTMGHEKAVGKVMEHIRRENWTKFIAKPVYGQESIDLKFFEPAQAKRFENYMSKSMAKYPGIVIQKEIKDFGNSEKSPELRMYFVGDKYKYTVSAMKYGVRLPKSEGGKFDCPLEKMKRVTSKVMQKLPAIVMRDGIRLPRLLTRMDMGYLVDGNFQPFVNEVEFVPSLYLEDVKKTLMDKELGRQMVKIAKLYVAAKAKGAKANRSGALTPTKTHGKARWPGSGSGCKKSTTRNLLRVRRSSTLK